MPYVELHKEFCPTCRNIHFFKYVLPPQVPDIEVPLCSKQVLDNIEQLFLDLTPLFCLQPVKKIKSIIAEHTLDPNENPYALALTEVFQVNTDILGIRISD